MTEYYFDVELGGLPDIPAGLSDNEYQEALLDVLDSVILKVESFGMDDLLPMCQNSKFYLSCSIEAANPEEGRRVVSQQVRDLGYEVIGVERLED